MTAQKKRSPRCPASLKDEILVAISDHRRRHGDKDWNLVREIYPTVVGSTAGPTGARRFWRWLKEVKDQTPTVEVARLRRAIGALQPGPEGRTRFPVGLAASVKRIDFHEQISLAFSDLDRLWQHCFEREADPDSPGGFRFRRDSITGDLVVADPRLLEKVTARRQALMTQAMVVWDRIWDMEEVEAVYEDIHSILKEVANDDPTLVRRVLERVKANYLSYQAQYELHSVWKDRRRSAFDR